MPPPTATPARDRLPLTLLRIDSGTTGEDLVKHLLAGEDTCLKSMMGDTKFRQFEGSLLMETAADPSFRTRLVVCLQRESLIVVGTRLIGAYQGGWGQETRQCATAIAFNSPELVFQALGVPDVGADPSDADETQGVLPDLYECLDTADKVRFAVEMMSYSLVAAPFSGQQFLVTLPESEVECLETNLPAPVFAMIAEIPSVGGGELRDAPPELLACLSAESISRIPAEAIALGIGATSEDSRGCVIDLISARGDYMDLLEDFAVRAEDLSPEESLEIAEDGRKLFDCLSDEELAEFQVIYLPTMLP